MVEVISSTLNCFQGTICNDIWTREEQLAEQVRSQVNNYTFPQLQTSYYRDIKRYKGIACRDLTWSYDGTSVCGVFDDFGVRQYLIPEKKTEQCWVPFTRWFTNGSIISSAVGPSYSLFEEGATSQTILCAMKDLPIKLYSLEPHCDNLRSLFQYSTVNEETESLETPHAMSILEDTAHFMTGSVRNRISVYDVNRNKPLWDHYETKKSCGNSRQGAIISCFDQFNEVHDTIRFAGNYKSEVLRVDARTRRSEHVSARDPIDSWSKGIYQIIRSDNGHYLYCLKRNAREIDIIDTRKVNARVNKLTVPFKIGLHKLKASLNDTKGLLLGSYNGMIHFWDKSCIEFGGLDPLQTVGDGLLPTGCFDVSNEGLRVNCISTNPTDPFMLSVSFASDKFSAEEPDISKTTLSIIQMQ